MGLLNKLQIERGGMIAGNIERWRVSGRGVLNTERGTGRMGIALRFLSIAGAKGGNTAHTGTQNPRVMSKKKVAPKSEQGRKKRYFSHKELISIS
jgi:hypothetical protein